MGLRHPFGFEAPLLGLEDYQGGEIRTHTSNTTTAVFRALGATTDQRGLPRPSDFASISNLEGGDGSDVGAFELQAPASPQPPAGPKPTVSLVAGSGARLGQIHFEDWLNRPARSN